MFFFAPMLFFGQKTLSGKVINSGEKEWIHVFNKTYNKYTITDEEGEFKIPVRINDTLVFSAIQFELKEIVISETLINEMFFKVLLKVQVNELDAVYIKRNLSGDLLADAKRIKTKDKVTARTLGLPNSHVIPPTQAERRLQTASNFSPQLGGSLGGVGGAVSLDAVINAISGRTKKLKNLVRQERLTIVENSVFEGFNQVMLDDFKIPKDKLYDFLYYASADKLFGQIVKTKSNIIIYDFIKAKSKTYLALQNQLSRVSPRGMN